MESRVCSITNENWRGKNDPSERRRIQNRLNQRAFRQRQRSGEHPLKQYKPSESSLGSAPDSSKNDSVAGDRCDDLSSTPATMHAKVVPSSDEKWDRGFLDNHQLSQLINQNFMAAASINARHLGISKTAMQNGTPVTTPQVSGSLPLTLQPTLAQYQISHDPIIDIVPHPGLRDNILRAIATAQIDAMALSRDLRASGALEKSNGSWLRVGLVVWSSPEQLASWEVSELFLRRWGPLLQGCDDFLATTNTWRSRRGEMLFPSGVVA
jgi:hypothetical protein